MRTSESAVYVEKRAGRVSRSLSIASLALLLGLTGALSRVAAQTYTFTTIAGVAAKSGSTDGTGGAANLPLFNQPIGLVMNSAGNLYVADAGNALIRVVTPAGVVTTLAGTPGLGGDVDGTGVDAGVTFNSPQGPGLDGAGNLYVADYNGDTIRKITPAGVVTTIAGLAGTSGSTDATGTAAFFFNPSAVVADSSGNLFVTDSSNNTIRKITSAGVVTTFAGTAGASGTVDGLTTAARFNRPRGLAIDSAGNLYVTDYNNNTIRKITAAGAVTTIAGTPGVTGNADGTGNAASFFLPTGLAVDSAGNIYVADTGNNTIRKVTPAGVVTTLAGTAGVGVGRVDGTGAAARFSGPTGVTLDSAGNIYVADYGNNLIRKVTAAGVVTTVAGAGGTAGVLDGQGYVLNPSLFNNPSSTAVDASGNVYVADTGNNTIRKVTSAGAVSTFAGSTLATGRTDGTGSAASFSVPSGVATDGAGNVYVADSSNQLIRMITPAGQVSTLAGTGGTQGSTDGAAASASFNFPSNVAADASGNVYVADYNNNTIRKIATDGTVSTLAGSAGLAGSADGTGATARFNSPRGVAVDSAGNVYVADLGNNTVRKISSGGLVLTLAGSAGSSGTTDGAGAAARFSGPSGLAVDGSGNVFVTDTGNSTIRMITSGGVVSTIGGTAGTVGNRDGISTAARFDHPTGVSVDAAGNLYIADNRNHTIRKGSTPASSGGGSGGGSGSGSGGTTTGSGGTDGSGGTSNTSGGTGSTGGTGGTGSTGIGTGFFLHPSGIAADASGNYYVTDTANNCIKKIDTTGVVTVFAGKTGTAGSSDGTGTDASFNGPTGITVDTVGFLYVCDTGNATIRKIDSTTGGVTTLAGAAGTRGTADGTGRAASFASPTGIAYNTVTTDLYVTDSVNCTIRTVSATGVVTTYAGKAKTPGDTDGTAATALFNNPMGLSMDASNNLYIADTYNNTIRKINLQDISVLGPDGVTPVVTTPAGTVTTLAGSAGISGAIDGTGIFSLFNQPAGVSVDGAGTIYVADTGNSSIRMVTARGVVTTLAGIAGISGNRDGAGTSALFNQPQGLMFSGSVLVTDTGNSILRSVALPTGSVATVALKSTATAPTTPVATPTGYGGGGAPSLWFYAALSLLGLGRRMFRQKR